LDVATLRAGEQVVIPTDIEHLGCVIQLDDLIGVFGESRHKTAGAATDIDDGFYMADPSESDAEGLVFSFVGLAPFASQETVPVVFGVTALRIARHNVSFAFSGHRVFNIIK
jgi:hypothetical protein